MFGTRTRVIALTVLMLGSSAPHAFAQIENKLAVGIKAGSLMAGSSNTDGVFDVGLEWRWNHGKPGWAWQVEPFNWFDTGVNEPIGGRTMALGRMHLRPVTGGYGYTWVRGRTMFTGELVAGYAFVSFDLDSRADEAYRSQLGGHSVTANASNTFVVNPALVVWHDVSKRIGVRGT